MYILHLALKMTDVIVMQLHAIGLYRKCTVYTPLPTPRQVILSVCVCVFVRALKEKRLELSTPNLVSTQCMAVARHEVKRSRSYQVHRTRAGMQVDM